MTSGSKEAGQQCSGMSLWKWVDIRKVDVLENYWMFEQKQWNEVLKFPSLIKDDWICWLVIQNRTLRKYLGRKQTAKSKSAPYKIAQVNSATLSQGCIIMGVYLVCSTATNVYTET